MASRNLLLALTAGVIVAGLSIIAAHAQAPAALTGQVSSAAGGPMEGVGESDRRAPSPLPLSVVGKTAGNFPSPAPTPSPARFSPVFRAAAYPPAGRKRGFFPAAPPPTADIKLRPTRNL